MVKLHVDKLALPIFLVAVFAGMMEEPCCFVCSAALPNSNARRDLHSSGSRKVLQLLKAIVCQHFAEHLNDLLPAPTSKFHICRPCYRKLERLENLKQQEAQLNAEIGAQVRQTVHLKFSNLLQVPPVPSAPVPSPGTPTSGRTQTPRRGTFAEMRRRLIPSTGMSPDVAVLVKSSTRQKTHIIPRASGLKTLARSVGRRNHRSIARQVLNNPKCRRNVLNMLSTDIQHEMRKASSKKRGSILRDSSALALKRFSWENVLSEMECLPTFHSFLKGCVDVKRRPRKSKSKTGKMKSRRVASSSTVLAVTASILLRHHNSHMNLFQRVVALVLKAGHASTQTYTRLQRLLLCISHRASDTYLDKLGQGFDDKVAHWRRDLELAMETFEDGGVQGLDVEVDHQTLVESQEIDTSPEEELDTPGSPISECSSPLAPAMSPITSESSTSCSDSSTSSDSSMDIDTFLGSQAASCAPPSLCTYKLVGDNIDKCVNPRHMTSDHQARSLHYFHTYALRDRIDLSNFSTEAKVPDPETIQLDNLLPSSQDDKFIRENFAVLTARVLMKHMPFFAKFGKGLDRHIRHEFSEEMSQKSEVVPLGIYLKGEQKYEEMVEVLEHLHKYVPTLTSKEYITYPGSGESADVVTDEFDQIPLGGDQMTVARIRGCQRIRDNAERGKEQLLGVTGVIEDWHAKCVLLSVAWKRLFKTSSGMNGGTLYQLRNLVNRRKVTKDPTKNVAASEEFFLLVTEAHLLSAVMHVFGMTSLDDDPDEAYFPPGSCDLDSLQRHRILLSAISDVLSKFVDLSCCEGQERGKEEKDHVLEYASEVLTLGLLLMEYNDCIHEGDGLRDIRCWRYFLPLFKANGRSNYSIEAFTLLAQYQFLFSPRMAMQLIWNRTVNVHGLPGRNIPCDLHMEHLNRIAKDCISGLGSNLSDHAIDRVGKSIGSLTEFLSQFDATNRVKSECGRHSKHSYEKDLKSIIKQLHEKSKVFTESKKRAHTAFPNFESNNMKNLKLQAMIEWMNQQLLKKS